MSKVMSITSTLAAMLAVAPGVLAQVPPNQNPPNIPWTVGRDSAMRFPSAAADSSYILEAIRGNFLEVALGRVAESRGADFDVKAFAKRMITDHNSMNDQWATVAKNNRVRVPVGLDETAKQTVDRLEDLSGSEFDQAYMTEMIRQHEQALATFQRMASSATAPDVRQLASSGVPGIREHLTLAQQIGSRVGISSTAGRVGDRTSGDTGLGTVGDRVRRTTGDNGNDRNDRSLRAADVAFIKNVVANHVTHIRMAELARRDAKSDEVRRLAERIENHMHDWGKRWEDVANRHDVKVSSNLGRLHQQKVDKVEKASKKDFDRTYLDVAAGHLESLVPYFQKEGRAIEAADVRRLVNDELPEIRELLARARRLEEKTNER